VDEEKAKRLILNYRDRDTERLARGEVVRRWEHLRRQAEKRLRVLEAARSVEDLLVLNSNRLKALGGDRRGQYSVRVNEQWRLCFEWPDGAPGPSNVELVDYH
jgi:proteic killer suppression protein